MPTQSAGKRRPKTKKAGEPKFPAELQGRAQWVAWRFEARDGKPTKVPYSPISGRRASTSNPWTWGTYAQALAFCEKGGMDGVGYVFSAEDPYTGVDLDKCRDPDTGVIDEWAQDIITALSSYTEVSPSGRGMHIIVQGTLPSQGRRKDQIELYDSGRYFTITGVHLSGTPRSVEPRQVELEAVHGRLWPVPPEAPGCGPLGAPTAAPRLTDEEVLEKALGARNGEKFARLWTGDTSNHKDDHSAADMALCALLAFWTQDPSQIDRLFRQSGLMRAKWDEKRGAQTDGERTITKALAMTTDTYGQSQPTMKGRDMTTLSDEDSAALGDEPPAIELLQRTVETHFPHLWLAVDLGLSVAATLLLEKNVNPVALIYVGKSGTGKTTVTTMFAGHPITYLSDKFTPEAFVSSAANVQKADLEKIDLLPKIQHKVLITPELAPTFRGKEDELAERFNTLIRVLDGQGLWIDSGSQGERGYKGDYLFAWLGGTTPLNDKVWRVMAQLGSRLFFLVLGDGEEVTEDDLVADGEYIPYMDRLAECRDLVHKVLTKLFGRKPKDQVRKVAFQVHSLQIRQWLARFARVLAKARGSRNLSDEGGGGEESPHRINAVLNNLAHGHAIVHGREKVTMADLPAIAEVTISSMPTAFSRLFRATVHAKELTVAEAQVVLGKVSHTAAKTRMEEAAKTGVFEFIEGKGRKPGFLYFASEWNWCNSAEFKGIIGCFQNSGGVFDAAIFESSTAPEEERDEDEEGAMHTPPKKWKQP